MCQSFAYLCHVTLQGKSKRGKSSFNLLLYTRQSWFAEHTESSHSQAGLETFLKEQRKMQAVAKFWETPELLGELFSFLDLKSALSLARVLDKDVLKRSLSSKVWRRLVKRSFDGVGILDWAGLDPETDYMHRTYRDETLDVAQKLATILKIANTPKTLLMDTLNLILQKRPPTSRRRGGYSNAYYSKYYSSSSLDNLQLASSHNSESRAVSKWGFIILEELEGALRRQPPSGSTPMFT